MTFDHINYIVNEYPSIKESHIGRTHEVEGDDGIAHPLWTLLNHAFPPETLWKSLGGAEREQVKRAARLLHEEDIPYHLYIEYLRLMNKGQLKTLSPFLITKTNPTKKGRPSLLQEYVGVIRYLKGTFKKNPHCLKIVDHVYQSYSDAYSLGALPFMHTVGLVENTLETHSTQEILQILNESHSLTEFQNSLGQSNLRHDRVTRTATGIDLEDGVDHSNTVRLLQQELRVRMGRTSGQPRLDLNKYFTRSNKLNKRGLQLIAEHN